VTPDRFPSGVSAYLAKWSLTLTSSSHTLMHQESHYCSIPAPNLSKIPTWQIEKEAHKYHLAMCLYLWLSHAIWTFTLWSFVCIYYVLCKIQNRIPLQVAKYFQVQWWLCCIFLLCFSFVTHICVFMYLNCLFFISLYYLLLSYNNCYKERFTWTSHIFGYRLWTCGVVVWF